MNVMTGIVPHGTRKDAKRTGCTTAEEPCLACRKLADIEAKMEDIAKIEDVIVRRKKRVDRMQLLREVNDAHDPMTKLFPPEIFVAILLHAIPTAAEMKIQSRGTLRDGPHIFAAVSKRWRELCIGTPHLWTHIPLFLRNDQSPTPFSNMLGLWLRRSGRSMPLSISMHVESTGIGYWGGYMKTIAHLMRQVNSVANRLVYFKAEGALIALRLLSFGTNAPNLRVLEIVSENWGSANGYYDKRGGEFQEQSDFEPQHYGVATPPTSLVMAYLDPSPLQMKLDNLTHAVINCGPGAGCLKLLQNAPRLVSLTLINCWYKNMVASDDSGIVTHSQLRTLNISGRRPGFRGPVTYKILGALCLPSLQNISLTEMHSNSYKSHADSLLALVHRSPTPLVSITLQDPGLLNSPVVPQMLLNHLVYDIIDLVKPTLRQLTVQKQTFDLGNHITG